jgi:putative holliday junction resolvase
MAIRNPTELRALMPRGKRLLGLDLGSKTIGLAIADPGFMVASPIGTIRRTKFTNDARELGKIIKEREVGALVIGLPVNMDGTEGPASQSARQFAANLLQQSDLVGGELEIAFWDERLSTAAVTRMMIEADMTRKRRGEVVDKMAAAYILQGALDALAAQAAARAAQEAAREVEDRDDDRD